MSQQIESAPLMLEKWQRFWIKTRSHMPPSWDLMLWWSRNLSLRRKHRQWNQALCSLRSLENWRFLEQSCLQCWCNQSSRSQNRWSTREFFYHRGCQALIPNDRCKATLLYCGTCIHAICHRKSLRCNANQNFVLRQRNLIRHKLCHLHQRGQCSRRIMCYLTSRGLQLMSLLPGKALLW